jgi:tetratricopeptide (TPR) repeat protein
LSGNHTEAIKYYDKALKSKYFDDLLKADPTNYGILEGKGEALAGIGNYTQAIQYFDKALAKNPISVELFHDKANALYKLGIRSEAIKYYDKILSINPNDKIALDSKKRLADEYVRG